MDTILKIPLLLLLASSLCCFVLAGGEDGSPLQTYIVHVQQPEGAAPFLSLEDREAWYRSFLPQTAINSDVRRMVVSPATPTPTTTPCLNSGSGGGSPTPIPVIPGPPLVVSPAPPPPLPTPTSPQAAYGPIPDVRRMVYSYQSAISGFAARLTADEVKAMESKDGFLQAYPDRFLQLLTTHTPDYLGLHINKGPWNDSRLGEGVIIGMLDTGITPGHPSFLDHGMPSPPSKWKGACHLPANVCNNKLIGARNFVDSESNQPIDNVGHGTHTAGTAAGNFVKKAALLGQAQGTAAGMAPHAHLAIYKVCTRIPLFGCPDSAIIAAIDAAIHDGVDVISMSIGSLLNINGNFYQDPVAIALFSAMEKGIFVSCAAGNAGPVSMSVTNGAPWVLTVAASTTDRTIRATVRLGDGRKFYGQALYQPSNFSSSTPLPLVTPYGSHCDPSPLKAIDVKGKVVLCRLMGIGADGFKSTLNVKEAGGAAAIVMNSYDLENSTFAELYQLPASQVSHADGTKIEEYYHNHNSTTANPLASIIFEGTKIDNLVPAPAITSSSSRGPNYPSPGILKPDITGPGVDILAAWNESIAPPPSAAFNMISGTSVSTPHLSGIAALLKSLHPDWSPAAITSAIVTTADVAGNDGEQIRDEEMKPASYYAMGAGHVNPTRASDPGLVYNLTAEDYIPYLCGLGYTDNQVTSIVKRSIKCSKVKSIAEGDLNYPSMVVYLSLGSKPVTVNRTVTNVGEPKSEYVVKVEAPAGVSVKVRPQKLHFSEAKETKKFTVSFSMRDEIAVGFSEGNLKWVSEKHVVTSPIVVNLV